MFSKTRFTTHIIQKTFDIRTNARPWLTDSHSEHPGGCAPSECRTSTSFHRPVTPALSVNQKKKSMRPISFQAQHFFSILS